MGISISLQKVLIGKKCFNDSTICKLELKETSKLLNLYLPDLNAVVPQIKRNSNLNQPTQFQSLKLIQKIYFSDINSIM